MFRSDNCFAAMGLLAIFAGGCTVGRSVLAPLDAGSEAATDTQPPPDTTLQDTQPPLDTTPPDTTPPDTQPPPDTTPPDTAAADTGTADVADVPLVCAMGLFACGASCVNLLTSTAHCGLCNKACPAMHACVNGTCIGPPPCASFQTLCGADAGVVDAGAGVCVDLLTNSANCGGCGRGCPASQACVNGVCIGTGDLRFTLTWDRAGDVDLHVTPPCGMNIYFASRMACGGTLDRDDTTGTGPENVFWTRGAARGGYLVCLVPYNITMATSAVVEVYEGSVLRQRYTRMFMPPGMPTTECSRTSPFFVGEFTY
ncbi:MAG: hypothetical protein HY909_04870 [Deltaproteobacteria bacterium]|nr:hypothetical protein [Deltaproteobacteria bacterium]